jgi:hypothetical protein
MITSEYKASFIKRKISLEIEDSSCILVEVIYFLGIKLRTLQKTFSTLLDAEDAYDNLCLICEKNGYDITDK